MNRTLKETYKNQKEYKIEARYYLEVNDYDLDKALTEFESDLQFEKEYNKNKGKIKKAL